MGKTRPAVVVNPTAVGRLPLRIVVPVTGWQTSYAAVPWLVHLKAIGRNGLDKESAADCFQVKSVALTRFVSKLGNVRAAMPPSGADVRSAADQWTCKA